MEAEVGVALGEVTTEPVTTEVVVDTESRCLPRRVGDGKGKRIPFFIKPFLNRSNWGIDGVVDSKSELIESKNIRDGHKKPNLMEKDSAL
ncbi:hypothetical protein D3C86_1725080 [compost metagenome]